jgi:hypothetical protein
MPTFDLFAHSKDPTPEHLLTVCDAFMRFVGTANTTYLPTHEILGAAETLAAQIISHYQTLQTVSDELSHFRDQHSKLPHQVFYVFYYACAREHEDLGTMLDEVHSVYEDLKDRRAYIALRGMSQDSLLMMEERPRLWGVEGELKYSPVAFSHMHGVSLTRQISEQFNEGVDGVQRILNSYPAMDEASRNMMDAELRKRVYRSVMPTEHPIRLLLRGKLDEVQDGLVRFKTLFDDLDDCDVRIGFKARLEHAFALVDSLPREKVSEVLAGINQCIRDWMTDHGDGISQLNEPDVAVPRLVEVLERAKCFGFNALEEVSRNVSYIALQHPNKAMIEALLDEGFVEDRRDLDAASAWKEAALRAASEEFYLSLGLDQKHLAQIFKFKPDPGIRRALLESDAGREIVLCQDLGL